MARVQPGRNFNNSPSVVPISRHSRNIGLSAIAEPSHHQPHNQAHHDSNRPETTRTHVQSHDQTIAMTSITAPSEAPNITAPRFQKKVTLMLMLMIVVLAIYPIIIPLLSQNATIRFIVNFASYVNLVNHAGYPFLYSCVDPRFRKDCVRLIRGLCHVSFCCDR